MAGRRDNEIGVTAGALGVLDTIARYAMGLAALVLLGCVGMLVFTYQVGSTGTAEQVSRNVQLFGGPAVLAAVVFGATIAYLNWGEEILGVLLLIGAGALVFAPSYLPLIFSGGSQTPNGTEALNAVSQAGIFLGIVAVIVLVVDGVTRIRDRAVLGAKADQLKFGKGIQEERDVQNVFLGKCWQLPYCRKFVREKCPIYHAKRTCWKERVGCMCEETVIRNAMQNKAVPKDPVAAAKMIPYNNRLPLAQKKERCAQCV
ncbi:MAG: hypothetical protein MH204_07310, partial [Fimbriimonadaceae bacterium]|nr:hypothetical protein [Fimbriimonadaceae bacterium]